MLLFFCFFFCSVDGLSGRDVVFKVWRDLWRLQRPADQSSALGGGGGGQSKRSEGETDCRVAGASAVKVLFFFFLQFSLPLIILSEGGNFFTGGPQWVLNFYSRTKCFDDPLHRRKINIEEFIILFDYVFKKVLITVVHYLVMDDPPDYC